MLLSDQQITERCIPPKALQHILDAKGEQFRPMIDPFFTAQVREYEDGKIISFGTSSYGYDIRIGHEFKVFHNVHNVEIDPKKFNEDSFITVDTRKTGKGYITIPPNSFALGVSFERLVIPRDVLAICLGKSTYARCGIIINVTPLEPEWEGYITMEISNTTPLPARVYAEEGIAQLLFLRADKVCLTSYADKGGKYQNQSQLTLPRM